MANEELLNAVRKLQAQRERHELASALYIALTRKIDRLIARKG